MSTEDVYILLLFLIIPIYAEVVFQYLSHDLPMRLMLECVRLNIFNTITSLRCASCLSAHYIEQFNAL